MEISYCGETWSYECFENISEINSEAGSSSQKKINLINKENGNEISVRAKKIDNINEAIIYNKLNCENIRNSLNNHIPKFVGLLDSNLNQVTNINRNLQGNHYWLLMENCFENSGEFDLDDESEVQDFKFSRSSLVGNRDEKAKHKHSNLHSNMYKVCQKIFFFISLFSFVYQKNCKKSGIVGSIKNIFNRLICIIRTKHNIRKQLKRLNNKQLELVIDKMQKLRSSLEKSNYVFCDSSLLFVPMKKRGPGSENGNKVLNIYLIDLAHGMHESENIEGFEQARADMLGSIDDLIAFATSRLDKRSNKQFFFIKNTLQNSLIAEGVS